MAIVSIVPGPLVLLLLLSSGISVPDVLLAIPWRVLLWHALGLGGVQFASCLIEFSTKLVRGGVPLLFVGKIGASCFLRRMMVRYGAAVVRIGGVSKVEILRHTLPTLRSDKNCFINWFLLNL